MWFSTYVSPVEHLNLSTVKSAFFSQFLPDEAQTDRFQELLEIRYRSNESVRTFSNRFIEKMRLNEIPLNSEDAAHSYIKKVYFFKLPASIRRFPGSMDINSFKSTQELIEKMCKFPGIPDDIKKFSQVCYQCNRQMRCVRCLGPQELTDSVPNNGTKRKVTNDKKDLKITLPNHPKGRFCYNECGEIYMPGHKCPKEGEYKKKKEEKRIAKAVMINDNQESSSLKEFERDLDFLCSKLEIPQISGTSSSFNYAPLLLNKKKYFAGIDSMATHSILSPKIVKELDVVILPQKGTITLADNSNTPRIGKTSSIEVKCKDVTLYHNFEIMETGGTGVILGRDLFQELNISIRGLPFQFPRIESDSIKPLENISPLIDPNKEELLSYLSPLLETNQGIQLPCNYPGSELFFKFNKNYKGPVIKRQYPMPHQSRQIIEDWIKKQLMLGNIQELKEATSWNSPLLVVPKRDITGSVKGHRVCIDPRHINLLLENVSYPLPLIKEIFGAMTGMSYFSKIDLESGFNQFLLGKESQEVTTFTWENKQYVFTVCPFGFKIVPAHFQSVMSKIFQKFQFVKVYIDDIIICSTSLLEHKVHLSQVFKELNSFNLKVKIDKCEFGLQEIIILGYKLSKLGIQVCNEKLLQMKRWTPPKNGKELQSHLGFINYFRDLIPLYSEIMAPLEAIRNMKQITWNEEYSNIYTKIQNILASDIILSFPDFNLKFCIGTDASDSGVGAVLFQVKNEVTHYINFAARSLSPSERNYGATKRELLAIIFALKKFHNYIYGTPFDLYTDHMALVSIFTQKNLNPMLERWIEILLSYNFTILHIKGIRNLLPDKISRFYEVPKMKVSAFKIDSVDSDHKRILLERAHLSGHFGSEAMFKALISNGHYWTDLRKDCIKEVNKCIPCQKFNIGKHGFHPLSSIMADLPMDHVAIDLKEFPKSEKGNQYLLVVVDVFTRFVFLKALKDKKAETIASVLVDIFCLAGFPKIIQSDNGKEFVNSVIRKICRASHIDHRLITPYNPQANGLAERWVQTTSQAIYKLLDGNVKSWDVFVPSIQYFTNLKICARHGSAPFSLFFARQANAFDTFSNSLKSEPNYEQFQKKLEYITGLVYPMIKKKTEEFHVITSRNHSKWKPIISHEKFPPGSLVMVKDDTRENKSDPPYEGPFIVIRRNSGGAYILKGKDGSEYQRVANQMKFINKTDNIDSFVDSSLQEIQKIIAKVDEDHFIVKFKGLKEPQKIHRSDFQSSNLISKFERPPKRQKTANSGLKLKFKVPKQAPMGRNV
jgi:transposase InsO family protein